MNISKCFKETEPYIIEMRRWFHQHPEVSLLEKETSAKIQAELTAMGISFEELKPNYGIVATIRGKAEGKSILIRADIDALPVQEETGLSFESCNKGVMHACGHDAHAAMLLGAAKVLNQLKDTFDGTVKLLFQSAEEIGLGVEEALSYLDRTGGVDTVIGLHIWSAIPEGEVLLIPGAVFAGGRGFICEVHGQGGHGARPDLVKDPIKAACELVQKFSSIPSNFYDVLDHCVVSTGLIQAGTLANIFPSEAVIQGSTRHYREGGQEKLEEIMSQIAEGVGKIYGVDVDLSFIGGVIPVKNQPQSIIRAKELVKEVEGLLVSPQTDPICAGDDFGFILDRYPGFYGVLGAGKKDEYNYPQHHCKFDIEECAFKKGSEFMTRYALDFLSAK